MTVADNGAIEKKTTEPESPTESPGDVERRDANHPMIGKGASAGGIAALQRFFPEVPADSGFAYVVIQHLDAEHDTKSHRILTGAGRPHARMQ
ncbi:chemotaxis protein CheB [Arvimicrobium flavum]|uniref:chemotaxis protein CheB n=1 Tax=Arvimicrobium flavum TaxID=3393320 RepID=UPI00237AC1F4|nr:chemotaxis protein CheB [Mesorhizobium shangrilense]